MLTLKGFRNLGNTCYMNAALQALLSSDILNNVIWMYLRKNPKAMDNFSPILLKYIRIIYDLIPNRNDDPIYTPLSFKLTLDEENKLFRGCSQHDANEFLIYVINEFVDDAVKKPNMKGGGRDKGMANIIRKLCFGKYREFIKCNKCNKVEQKYTNYFDVLLPIPNKINPDLEDCFKQFAKFEILDESNKWTCPSCNEKVVVTKKMELAQVPDVAIFTLKRFRGTEKNTTPVKIYERITLEDKRMKLVATVNHYGGTGGGHYIAHVSRKNQWYRADDTSIQNIDVRAILNDASIYMVVYQVEYDDHNMMTD
jgi:ubiquitin C-terminal hydrolase